MDTITTLRAAALPLLLAACGQGTMTDDTSSRDAGLPPGDGGGVVDGDGGGAGPIDAGGRVPTSTGCVLPPELSGGPELPRETVDTRWVEPTGATHQVPAGGDLQAALDAAAPGDEIVLEAGAAYVGHFRLPEKSGDGWVLIRSSAMDALPPEGGRVRPEDAANMPALVTPDASSVITTAPRAHHYRFVGIEMRAAEGVSVNEMISFGSSSATDAAEQPHHLIVDRCYVHGDPAAGGKRGIQLNSAWTAVIGSWVSDWKRVGQDTQAIAGWNGPGPFRIVNNYLEGAGENVMFGGADARIPDVIPSDIEICGNHFAKPLTWKADDPTYEGTHWSVKNLFELKVGRRVLVSANLFEHCWTDAQTGFAIVIKSANQDGGQPWAVTEHLTFAHNVIRHSNNGFNLSRTDGGSLGTNTVRVHGNLFHDIGGDRWGGDGRLFQVLSGVHDATFDGNTGFGRQVFLSLDGSTPNERFVFTRNVLGPTRYGLHGSGQGEGTTSIDTFTPGATFEDNVIVGAASSRYPAGNHFPSTVEEVGFVDPGSGDYRLADGSPYATAAEGGGPLGADVGALREMTASVASD